MPRSPCDLKVRPADLSGVVVRFPMRVSHGALLRLVHESGRPLPVGSAATLATTGVAVPVGYDGEAYVEDLGRCNRLESSGQTGTAASPSSRMRRCRVRSR